MERIDRRTYLSAVVGGTLVLAGCAGDEDEDPDSDPAVETPSAEDGDATASANESESTDEEDEPAESDEPTTAEIGELLEVGDFELIVYDLERVDDVVTGSNDEVLEADDGAAFAVVDFAVRYVGEQPVTAIDELLTIELTGDGESAEFATRVDQDASADTEEMSDDSEETSVDAGESSADNEGMTATADIRLAPGEVSRQDLVYEIDDEAEDLTLEIEFDADSEEYVVDLESEAGSGATLEQDPTDDVLSFSQGVDTAGLAVTVTGLEHGNNLGGFMQSDEGHEIVAVGVTIENESGRERTLSPEQAQLKDESGRSYEEVAGAISALEGFADVALKDGEEYDRKIAYQLEEGVSELYWVFDFSAFGEDQRVFWKLR